MEKIFAIWSRWLLYKLWLVWGGVGDAPLIRTRLLTAALFHLQGVSTTFPYFHFAVKPGTCHLGGLPSGATDERLANPARSGRKQRQPALSCRGTLADPWSAERKRPLRD